MTVAPATLNALAAYWREHDGDPTADGVTLGIVGDAAHQARASYHNGQDVITAHGRTATNDYSIRHERDREPYLTNAAAAIDLGKLEGSYKALRLFSEWLVAQCIAKAPRTADIREIIYASSDGKYVKRYDRLTGKVVISLRKNADGSITVINAGQGDSSHFWHTHISYHRDSEKRDKTIVFRPYFEPATMEDDMPALTSYLPGYTIKVAAGKNVRATPSMTGVILRATPAGGETWTIIGMVKGDVDPESGSDQWYVRWAGTRYEYTAKVNAAAPVAPVTDCTAAVKAATDPLNAQIAAKTVENATLTVKLNTAEALILSVKNSLKALLGL